MGRTEMPTDQHQSGSKQEEEQVPCLGQDIFRVHTHCTCPDQQSEDEKYPNDTE